MAGDTLAAPPASGERAFTDSQLQDAQRIMEEIPRIEAALKNYLSLKMAEGLAPAGDSVEAESASTAPAASAAALTGCARAILKVTNSLELPSGPQWSQSHPQGEFETGLDFMARIGAYKVVQALWERCRKSDQKPAKFLGRTALRQAYPEIKARLLGDLPAFAAQAKASEQQLVQFVEGFEATLAEECNDADIVWAANMAAALAARQEARKVEAAERVQRAATADDFSQQLKVALGVAPSQAASSVQIEEVCD